MARGNLPPGVLFHRKARTRGNARKEFFLVVCGDPEVSAPWLARQIHNLEARNFDVQRSRAGAQFDTNQRPALVFDEDSGQENTCQPPSDFPKQAASRSRSREVHQKGRQHFSHAPKSRFQVWSMMARTGFTTKWMARSFLPQHLRSWFLKNMANSISKMNKTKAVGNYFTVQPSMLC